MMSQDREARKEEGVAEALERALKKGGFSQATLSRIIVSNPTNLSRMRTNLRPYSTVLARLYLLTKDEKFAPRDDNEREAYERERANPPAPLREYLEKGVVPPSPPTMWEVRRMRAAGRQPIKATLPPKPVPGIPIPIPLPAEKAQAEPKVPASKVEPVSVKFDSSKVVLQQAMQILCAIMGTDLSSLHDLVQTQLGQNRNQAPGNPPGIVGSPWFDRVLAGFAEVGRQGHQGVRFVITADRFQPFEGRFTKAETEDTKLLIQELRRRLNVSVQITDITERSRLANALARELDELYLSIELSKEAVPTGAAIRIGQMRSAFAKITGKPSDGKDNENHSGDGGEK